MGFLKSFSIRLFVKQVLLTQEQNTHIPATQDTFVRNFNYALC